MAQDKALLIGQDQVVYIWHNAIQNQTQKFLIDKKE